MGRAMSPVAGIIIAVSKSGECSPFMIVRRTVIPARRRGSQFSKSSLCRLLG